MAEPTENILQNKIPLDTATNRVPVMTEATITIGGEFLIDGSISLEDGISSSVKATIFDYTNSNPLAIRLTDTNGNYVDAAADTEAKALRQLVEYSAGNPVYVGEAAPGTLASASSWRIKKITYISGDPTDISWADGVGTFTKVWNSRASYDYTPDA